jgi:hypothetical protein
MILIHYGLIHGGVKLGFSLMGDSYVIHRFWSYFSFFFFFFLKISYGWLEITDVALDIRYQLVCQMW